MHADYFVWITKNTVASIAYSAEGYKVYMQNNNILFCIFEVCYGHSLWMLNIFFNIFETCFIKFKILLIYHNFGHVGFSIYTISSLVLLNATNIRYYLSNILTSRFFRLYAVKSLAKREGGGGLYLILHCKRKATTISTQQI